MGKPWNQMSQKYLKVHLVNVKCELTTKLAKYLTSVS